MGARFVWDEEKNRENRRKHGVSFEEAVTIFAGLPLEVFHDPDHSMNEERYIAVGVGEKSRVLVVVHCENETASEVRIISARKATKREQSSAFGRTWS